MEVILTFKTIMGLLSLFTYEDNQKLLFNDLFLELVLSILHLQKNINLYCVTVKILEKYFLKKQYRLKVGEGRTAG